jgi:hypothetical protein
VHTPSALPVLYCCTAQGHPVAIVTARETAAGLSTVLGSAMRQLLGSPTPADDVEALLAWWAEEWGRHYSSSSVGTARPSQLTPGKNAKQQQQQQQMATADDDMAAEDSGAAASAAVRDTTPSKQRSGRSAAACTPPASAHKSAAAATATTPSTTGRKLRARSQQPRTPAGSMTPRTAGDASCGSVPLQAPVLVLQVGEQNWQTAECPTMDTSCQPLLTNRALARLQLLDVGLQHVLLQLLDPVACLPAG